MLMGKGNRGRGILLLLGFLACFEAAFGGEDGAVNLWPMPKSVSHGSRTLSLSKDFKLTTQGSKYPDDSSLLKEAFKRMVDVVQVNHIVDGRVPNSMVLAGLNVAISSADDVLKFGVNESYKLHVPAVGSLIYANIEAKTVYGALHALETFSQLCHFNFDKRIVELYAAPWSIFDKPRFPFRGLLIDTSRHYLPLPVIKVVIDSMAYSKLNVLHWHIVDEQSFPLEIPSYPRLWSGSYSYSERYTVADALEIVQYAQRRGINVLAEIDIPGHARSWGVGYPALWPSTECNQPLDVSNEFTFKVIDGILSDFSKIFKFKFVHLGGDEVNTSCWSNTPHVKEWLNKHGMNESEAYKYFVLRAQKIAISHGYEVVNWEETFNNFGRQLNPETVVHNWLGGGVAKKVVAAGLRCIVSNQDKWYLDHLDATWEGFYMNEPLINITEPEEQKRVIGGEVCMWGEHIDASDIEQTIWPRAAAAAERLWTPLEKLANDPTRVTGRLARFRCLLNQRGIAAAPLAGLGRAVPIEPGSCLKQ
ncbi:beta-hexosaminidase 3-like [Zingiber officinale]|uniref:Beta-hexosaminidase n=1 Tax=Zingiber officinale TaxID=94328 RepID=A0A8J5L2U5_ZINOF|nr:beta-hexosaminidase 3-like [Zingiber officinale]KAG6503367.1 hypothetical protein ZIOFF_035679 [Zingiber officinale]